MQRRYIVCDPGECTGCRLCEFACALEKTGSFDLELSRIRVASPQPTAAISIACQLCEGAPCVSACPRDALSVRPQDGTIGLEKALCTGCGWCIEACDFGAIAMDPGTKSVVICDLCSTLPTPACVEACPKKALSLSPPSAVAGRSRRTAAEKLLKDVPVTEADGRGRRLSAISYM
ncbi:MAG TPA: 4Fe-4S dicluster domain-containing protein [Chloroflexota bacterium]|nr:4Fe-4S dicluster domain-containing protein [Chloroflexota bacterium]